LIRTVLLGLVVNQQPRLKMVVTLASIRAHLDSYDPATTAQSGIKALLQVYVNEEPQGPSEEYAELEPTTGCSLFKGSPQWTSYSVSSYTRLLGH